jgi:glycosyltransferase involved in cell wall biosynthesis
MRLLIATGLYPPEIGGPATYTKLFEDRLPAEGIQVSVLPFSTVRHLPPLIRHVVYTWKLGQMARIADCILVQDTVSTGVPAALVSRMLGIKMIMRVPGDYAWEQGVQRLGVNDSLEAFQKKSYSFSVGLLRFLQRFSVKSATRVISPSEYLAAIVRGWGVDNIRVIYNGIDLTKSEAVREENLIVSAGRLVPWKGFEQLVEIVLRHPEWRLVIVGDGPDKKKLVSLANGSDRIMLAGALTNKELRTYMARATVFVLNSDYEGLSHILLEASAEGAPIIATNVGGNPEVVRDSGVLINHENLERELTEMMNNPKRRAQLSSAARMTASEFSIDRCVEKTATLLKSL